MENEFVKYTGWSKLITYVLIFATIVPCISMFGFLLYAYFTHEEGAWWTLAKRCFIYYGFYAFVLLLIGFVLDAWKYKKFHNKLAVHINNDSFNRTLRELGEMNKRDKEKYSNY